MLEGEASLQGLDATRGQRLKAEAKRLGLNTYQCIGLVNLLRRCEESDSGSSEAAVWESIGRGDLDVLADESLLVPKSPEDPLIKFAVAVGEAGQGWEMDDDDDDEGDSEDEGGMSVVGMRHVHGDANTEQLAERLAAENAELRAALAAMSQASLGELPAVKATAAAAARMSDAAATADDCPPLEADDDCPPLEVAPADARRAGSTATKTAGVDAAGVIVASRGEQGRESRSKWDDRRKRGGNKDKDQYYFDSYAHLDIHYEMLSDRVRTESYRDCIEGQAGLFKDKVVLDVGCGTGILSMFAARAGAKLVIGVDSSDIIDKAREIVRRNGLDDRVVLVRGKVEQVQLPVDHVDIIVSEWMGYFLLFESMLDTVLYARDKWLRPVQTPTGPRRAVFPNRGNMQLAASEVTRMSYWDDVYGFDYRSIVGNAKHPRAYVEVVPPTDICSDTVDFWNCDFTTCRVEDQIFTAPFRLTIARATTLRGFVSHFDTMFDNFLLPESDAVTLSTSPQTTPTHWKQTLFALNHPAPVAPGDVVQGTLVCARNIHNHRDLDVTITYKIIRYRDGSNGDASIADDEPERTQVYEV